PPHPRYSVVLSLARHGSSTTPGPHSHFVAAGAPPAEASAAAAATTAAVKPRLILVRVVVKRPSDSRSLPGSVRGRLVRRASMIESLHGRCVPRYRQRSVSPPGWSAGVVRARGPQRHGAACVG